MTGCKQISPTRASESQRDPAFAFGHLGCRRLQWKGPQGGASLLHIVVGLSLCARHDRLQISRSFGIPLRSATNPKGKLVYLIDTKTNEGEFCSSSIHVCESQKRLISDWSPRAYISCTGLPGSTFTTSALQVARRWILHSLQSSWPAGKTLEEHETRFFTCRRGRREDGRIPGILEALPAVWQLERGVQGVGKTKRGRLQGIEDLNLFTR
eukprot:753326-Hanusia_phi.AAC.2